MKTKANFMIAIEVTWAPNTLGIGSIPVRASQYRSSTCATTSRYGCGIRI